MILALEVSLACSGSNAVGIFRCVKKLAINDDI